MFKKYSSFILFILFFLGNNRFAIAEIPPLSTTQQALSYLEAHKIKDSSSYWIHVKPKLFTENLRLNVTDILSFYPGRSTNFCAYGALSYLVIHNDPLAYVQFMIALFENGEATFHHVFFKPSGAVMLSAGDLRFKGVLDIRHAEQMWFLTLADHFKGYLNFFNRHYNPGDENSFWAATNLAKFNRMVKKMTLYHVQAVGSDLVRPWVNDMTAYLQKRIQDGITVLYINNRIIHKKNHDKIKYSIPTHYVILESIKSENNVVTLIYWDYGNRTQIQVSPKVLRKIIFGVSHCTLS